MTNSPIPTHEFNTFMGCCNNLIQFISKRNRQIFSSVSIQHTSSQLVLHQGLKDLLTTLSNLLFLVRNQIWLTLFKSSEKKKAGIIFWVNQQFIIQQIQQCTECTEISPFGSSEINRNASASEGKFGKYLQGTNTQCNSF